MTGYSGTPLAQKLGLKQELINAALHTPQNYPALLPEFHGQRDQKLDGQYDWLHAFYTEAAQLDKELPSLREHLNKTGQLWISWPKKAARAAMPTDLDENIVRELGLQHGLVDVKVAAIDDIWSGLKFVYRLKDR